MGYYYEDIEDGQIIETDARTITETDVVNFAGVTGDFNALHTNAEYAGSTAYGQRIAHGALIFSVMTGFMARTRIFDGTVVGFLGIKNWQFKKPVFIGDTIHAEIQLVKERLTSDGKRGIVNRLTKIFNQRGEVVHEGVTSIMIKSHNFDTVG